MKGFILTALLVFTIWWGWSSWQKSGELHAQNTDQRLNEELVDQHLQEFLRMRNQMIKEMEKEMEQFFPAQSFGPGSKGLSLQTDFFEDGEASGGVSYDWEETSKERILVIKPTVKKAPIDINIKNDQIEIKGKYSATEENKNKQMRSARTYHGEFTNLLPLPSDVDGKKAKIEARGDDILVRLPKVENIVGNEEKGNGTSVDKTLPHRTPNPSQDRKPLRPDDGDITI